MNNEDLTTVNLILNSKKAKEQSKQELEDLTEICLSSETLYEGSVLKLKADKVKLPNNETSRRVTVSHPGGVVIIPITNDGLFVLVEQYRYAVGQKLLEFPAGRLNPPEDTMKAALRELREETGYTTENIKFLGHIFTAPGFCSEKLFIYLANDLIPGELDTDEDEFVKPIHLSPEELKSKILNGEICDAKTIAGLGLIQGLQIS